MLVVLDFDSVEPHEHEGIPGGLPVLGVVPVRFAGDPDRIPRLVTFGAALRCSVGDNSSNL